MTRDMTPEELEAYYPVAEANAHANMGRALQESGPAMKEISKRVLGLAAAPVAMPQKLQQMRFAAGQWNDLIVKHSACKNGCSHCCHIGVMVTSAEAKLMGSKIGVPCTFLGDKGCEVYENRPYMCRTQLNVDNDERLCRIVKGQTINVPYADATVLKAAMTIAAMKDRGVADIREWFPHGLNRGD